MLLFLKSEQGWFVCLGMKKAGLQFVGYWGRGWKCVLRGACLLSRPEDVGGQSQQGVQQLRVPLHHVRSGFGECGSQNVGIAHIKNHPPSSVLPTHGGSNPESENFAATATTHARGGVIQFRRYYSAGVAHLQLDRKIHGITPSIHR